MLEKELGKSGFEALLKSAPMQAAAERCNYHTVEDLLAALGYGEVTLNLIVNRLRDAAKVQQTAATPQPSVESQLASLATTTTSKSGRELLPAGRAEQSPILGVEGLVHHLAGCCNPIPGEPIIGVVTLSSRGISIHRQGCQNLDHIVGERLIPLSWNSTDSDARRSLTYPVNAQVEVIDRVGVLKDILSRLADSNINVRNVNLSYRAQIVLIDLCIEVRDRDQMERTFTQVRKLSDVLNLRRISQAET
jgi:GTP pyrophosphokinase